MKYFLYILFFIFSVTILKAQNNIVSFSKKISETNGGFTGQLSNTDQFGMDVANLGDLDGDGFEDIAVGANLDDDSGTDQGAVWILFLNANSNVKSHKKISSGFSGFTGITTGGTFGSSIDVIGDLDNDGVVDLVVGEPRCNEGGQHTGAVWILFLNTNGTVKAHQKISQFHGNFTGTFTSGGKIGNDVAGIGDINNDGILDIAVSAGSDNEDGYRRGSVWILFLNANGTVSGHQKISQSHGNFNEVLDDDDLFGTSICTVGDLNNDGVNDLLVGVRGDDDGGVDKGAVWILFLNNNGTVASKQKISSTVGGFTGQLGVGDYFGVAADTIGDFDGDNIMDVAVGAYRDDGNGIDRGAVWILFLNVNGTVKNQRKIGDNEGGFTGALQDYDEFGSWGITVVNDLNNDGQKDLVVGCRGSDDGGIDKGAIWILNLNPKFTLTNTQKLSSLNFNLTIYPNPNHGQFIVKGFPNEDFNIRIWNVSGQLIHDFRVEQSIEQLEIHLENHGVYFLEYMNDDGLRSVEKILVTD